MHTLHSTRARTQLSGRDPRSKTVESSPRDPLMLFSESSTCNAEYFSTTFFVYLRLTPNAYIFGTYLVELVTSIPLPC